MSRYFLPTHLPPSGSRCNCRDIYDAYLCATLICKVGSTVQTALIKSWTTFCRAFVAKPSISLSLASTSLLAVSSACVFVPVCYTKLVRCLKRRTEVDKGSAEIQRGCTIPLIQIAWIPFLFEFCTLLFLSQLQYGRLWLAECGLCISLNISKHGWTLSGLLDYLLGFFFGLQWAHVRGLS